MRSATHKRPVPLAARLPFARPTIGCTTKPIFTCMPRNANDGGSTWKSSSHTDISSEWDGVPCSFYWYCQTSSWWSHARQVEERCRLVCCPTLGRFGTVWAKRPHRRVIDRHDGRARSDECDRVVARERQRSLQASERGRGSVGGRDGWVGKVSGCDHRHCLRVERLDEWRHSRRGDAECEFGSRTKTPSVFVARRCMHIRTHS